MCVSQGKEGPRASGDKTQVHTQSINNSYCYACCIHGYGRYSDSSYSTADPPSPTPSTCCPLLWLIPQFLHPCPLCSRLLPPPQNTHLSRGPAFLSGETPPLQLLPLTAFTLWWETTSLAFTLCLSALYEVCGCEATKYHSSQQIAPANASLNWAHLFNSQTPLLAYEWVLADCKC